MIAQTTAPVTYRPAGTLDVSTALAPYGGPWNERLAAHLARRAGFGESPDGEARLARLSMHDAVDEFVHFGSTSSLAAMPDLTPPPSIVAAAFPGLSGMGGMGGGGRRLRAMGAPA